MQRPTIVVKTGLIDDERTISGLLPVARIASPSFVLRKSARRTPTIITASNATISLYCSMNGVFLSKSSALVKTVSVLLRLRIDELPMTAMLIEYSAVLTMIPASRLLTPIFVCRTAVMSPESIPAAMAAATT